MFTLSRMWYVFKKATIAWTNHQAHIWLLKHDFRYRLKHVSSEVVRRQEVAQAEGASHDVLDGINMFSVAKTMNLKI